MTDSENSKDALSRLERRLKRERAARSEAERIAEEATRRLHRQQRMLTALVSVASTANESDSIAESSQACLNALADNTVCKQSRAFYVGPDRNLQAVAWRTDNGNNDEPPSRPCLPQAQALLASATTAAPDMLDRKITLENGSEQYGYFFPICAGGVCYGFIEAFSDYPDTDPTFTRELLTDLTQQLGYVYRREWEGHATDHFAYHDALTGVGNRLLFYNRLRHSIRLSDREKRRLGLISVDVDNLKEFNDSAGHAAGDEYLCLIANRLEETMRDSDTLARLGGDEFALVLESFDGENAGTALVDRLMSAIRQPARLESRTITPSVSIGLAIYPDDATTLEELLQCADSAMYQAKAAGGSRILTYNKAG